MPACPCSIPSSSIPSSSSSSSSSSNRGSKKKPKTSNTKNCEQILNDLMRSNPQGPEMTASTKYFPTVKTQKNGKRTVKSTADEVPIRCVFGTKVRLDVTEIGRKHRGGQSTWTVTGGGCRTSVFGNGVCC